MKKIVKVLLTMYILSLGFGLTNISNAQNDFEIIPESMNPNIGSEVESIGEKPGDLRNKYSEIAEKDRSLGDEMASGIMNRDTLLDYAVI